VSKEKGNAGGLSVKTLLIAGAASAIAAFVIPVFWRPGTVFAAAMTPIIVALVTEALRRPVDTVSSVTVRRTSRGTAVLERPEQPSDEPFDPLAPPTAEEIESLPVARTSQPNVHRRRRLTARQWRIGILTGLVAFLGAAAVVTASELIAGDPVSGGSGGTTFFGGNRNSQDSGTTDERDRQRRNEADESESPTPTATPTATETPEGEETPTPTPTPTPTATPTPAPAPGTLGAEPEATPPAEPTPVP
jgi:hypothetical protein